EIFVGFFVDESVARFVPTELETGGKRGDPDFPDGGVGRDHKFGLPRFLEENFELSGFSFDVETVFIARREHAALEVLERGVGFSLKVLFIEHAFSVHELSESWVVGSTGTNPKRCKARPKLPHGH